VVPVEIEDRALAVIEELFPYAGLLSVGFGDHYSWEVHREITPRSFFSPEGPSVHQAEAHPLPPFSPILCPALDIYC